MLGVGGAALPDAGGTPALGGPFAMLALLDGAPEGFDMEDRMEGWASEQHQHLTRSHFAGQSHSHMIALTPFLHTIRSLSIAAIEKAERD